MLRSPVVSQQASLRAQVIFRYKATTKQSLNACMILHASVNISVRRLFKAVRNGIFVKNNVSQYFFVVKTIAMDRAFRHKESSRPQLHRESEQD